MKRTKISILILVSLLTLQTLNAQTTQFTGSLLWKISGKGLKTPSFVFGTHHLIRSSFADSVPHFWDAFNSTSQAVGEMVLDNMPDMQTKMMQVAMLPEGMSYSEMLSQEEYTALDEKVKQLLGVGMDQLGVLHPALISVTAMAQVYAKYDTEFVSKDHLSIDELVQNAAKEKGNTIIGLETIEEQIDVLFNSEPIETQAKSLACMFGNFESALEGIISLLTKYYIAGKLNEMDILHNTTEESHCPISTNAQNALVKNRNDNWLKKLPAIMHERPSFIAVGALHLAGEEGLLFQLDKMGYTVEAVK